jgi:hypothetical protein
MVAMLISYRRPIAVFLHGTFATALLLFATSSCCLLLSLMRSAEIDTTFVSTSQNKTDLWVWLNSGELEVKWTRSNVATPKSFKIWIDRPAPAAHRVRELLGFNLDRESRFVDLWCLQAVNFDAESFYLIDVNLRIMSTILFIAMTLIGYPIMRKRVSRLRQRHQRGFPLGE